MNKYKQKIKLFCQYICYHDNTTYVTYRPWIHNFKMVEYFNLILLILSIFAIMDY